MVRIAGFDKDCPLYNIIRIRTEKNKDIIDSYDTAQYKIYHDWKKKKEKELKESPYYEEYMRKKNEQLFASFASHKKNKK